MYKNIKDLNLEIITIEDQVLLIDSNKSPQEGDCIYWNKMIVKAIDTTYSKDTKYIIASTKPLVGLPLLVIEDDVERLAKEYSQKLYFEESYSKNEKDWLDDKRNLIEIGFIQGYEKAKSTYKFTEEDMIEFAEWVDNMGYRQVANGLYKSINDEKGKSTKELLEIWKEQKPNKELWIEVVFNSKYGQRGSWTYGDYELANKNLSEFMVVKITDGKIKAIWK